MNRQAGKLHTLRRESALHFKGLGAVKRGLFCRHRLRSALILPAAALLLYSCDPPVSNPGGTQTQHVKTKSDGSTITTKPTAEGGTLAVHRNPGGTETQRVETKSDGSSITTTPAAKGGTLVVYKDSTGTETLRVETRSDKSTITTKPTAGGITKELVIHSSLTGIEDKAFENKQLTSLTVGNGVKTIGKQAFAGNPKLKTVTITGTGPVASNAFKGIFSASGSSGIELIIQEGITAIGDEAFQNNKLTSVSIPPSVTAIGEAAFWDNNLTSLTIGNSVKTIGNEAFSYNKLTSVSIPPSVTAIGEAAFADNKLTSVILAKALYDARGDAFDDNPAGLRFYEYSASAPGGRGPEFVD